MIGDDKAIQQQVTQRVPFSAQPDVFYIKVADIVVRAKLMDYKTENYEFDRRGNVSGWDEIRTFNIEVKNTRDIGVKVEIKRNFNTSYWKLNRSGDFGEFEKVDMDTVKFNLGLRPRLEKKFEYDLRTYHGTREDDWQ